MGGDRDDFGLKRDVANYFRADATELDSQEAGAAQETSIATAPPQVMLRHGDAIVSVAGEVFVRAWASAFWPAAPWGDFAGMVSAEGVRHLATAAHYDGHCDLADKLKQFASKMTGSAAVIYPDGTTWKVPVKVGENKVTSLPAPMGGGPKKVGGVVRPNTKPAPTASVNISETTAAKESDLVAAEFAEFFAKDDEEETEQE